MNDFLTSVFPRAYAKIYNGMIQINGASFEQRSKKFMFDRLKIKQRA